MFSNVSKVYIEQPIIFICSLQPKTGSQKRALVSDDSANVPSLRSELVIGLNDVAKALKKGMPLRLVIICKDLSPMIMVYLKSPDAKERDLIDYKYGSDIYIKRERETVYCKMTFTNVFANIYGLGATYSFSLQ